VRGVLFSVSLLLLAAASPAEAADCDCDKKIGRCSATANWVGASDWIEFRSNTSACSFIGYRIGNDFSYSITITDGSYRDQFLRTTKQRPEVEAHSCVVCATTDETKRTERKAPQQRANPARSANRAPPEASAQSDQPEASAQRQVIQCPERRLPEGAPNAAENNRLFDTCREFLPRDSQPVSKTKKPMTAKELEALRRDGEAKIREAREKKAREQRQRAAEKQALRAQQELQRQRQQQTLNAILNAVGAGVSTYNAYPKYQKPKPLPPTVYKSPKAQRAPVRTPATSPPSTTTSTNCPGAQVVVDENCRPLH
jgi:hypothetical protein